MDLRVVKRNENLKKGNFIVVLEGKSYDILSNCEVDIELKISAKHEDLIDSFPTDQPIFFKMTPKKED